MTQETPINPPETVEKAKLEALVDLWRGMSEQNNVPDQNATTLEWCANELEETLNE